MGEKIRDEEKKITSVDYSRVKVAVTTLTSIARDDKCRPFL